MLPTNTIKPFARRWINYVICHVSFSEPFLQENASASCGFVSTFSCFENEYSNNLKLAERLMHVSGVFWGLIPVNKASDCIVFECKMTKLLDVVLFCI